MRLNIVRALAAVLTLALAGCAVTTVKIGHVAPLTGPIAHLGRDNENGARMAVDELNAKGVTIGGTRVKLELVAENDAADPKQGTAAAQRLVDANVSGVVGHLNSGTSVPASKIYFQAGIPQISPSATNPMYTRQGFNTAFRITMDDAQLAETMARYAVSAYPLKKIAVIDDGTAYGQGVAQSFAQGVMRASPDVQIVATEHVGNRATDFQAMLTRVAAGAPDAVFFGGMDAQAGPMLRQMRTLGIHAKFIGADGICTQVLPRLAGNAIEDGQVLCGEAGGVTEGLALEAWKAAYLSKFGIPVQIYSPHTYDAVMVLVEAMQQAGSSDPAKYLPYVAKVRHRGITGDIEFDDKGDNKDALATIHTYRGGVRTVLGVTR